LGAGSPRGGHSQIGWLAAIPQIFLTSKLTIWKIENIIGAVFVHPVADTSGGGRQKAHGGFFI